MNTSTSGTATTFDRSAATTRSMLGWGVVAGPFYLVVGLALALSRPGFDLSRHALSLLMLGEWGWLQRANLALAGIMTIVAAVGMIRAIRSGRGLALGVLTSVYGGALVLSAVFAPDPMGGFPAGQADGTASLSGILHLLFGALGFAAVAAAAFAYAGWSRRVGAPRRAALGVVLGVVIVGGFFGGAAMATTAAGVGLLWLAVVAAWTWLAVASAHVYAWSPHPLGAR
ncbi:hypothetical protein GCM10017608_34040 [Agromyces luteolus]|nr:DUF998 domain-containing protein [Agromyces luteolus]GLK29466.1 hypothetical protein GCM10017608_34040 [Agromyces luteolus]